MRKFFIFLTSIFSCFAGAQDVHFAQLSEIPLMINPALTGEFDGSYRGILNYRNQWPAMGKAFNSVAGSFDMPLKLNKKQGAFLGGGVCFLSDKAGDSGFGTTQAKFSLSGILPVNQSSRFSAGLQFGLMQHRVNISDVQWPNQYNGQNYDPGIASNEQMNKNSFSFLDMALGVNYTWAKSAGTLTGKDVFRFNAGAAFFHPSMPLQKFYASSDENQYAKIVGHASLRYDFPDTKVGIVPSIVYMSQGPATELFFGGLVRYKINQGTKVTGFSTESAFSAGLFYRANDAFSPQLFFEFSDYAIGISYDFNVSSYGQVQKSAGGFELSLKYANMKGAIRK